MDKKTKGQFETLRDQLKKLNRQYCRALQILDGLMLGDGGITKYTSGTGVFAMTQSKKRIAIEDHIKWLEWLRDNVFTVLGIDAEVSLYWARYGLDTTKPGQPFQYVRLYTRTSNLLGQIYDEWYTGENLTTRRNNKGTKSKRPHYYISGKVKVLPVRLLKASTLPIPTLAPWFLGDGENCRRLPCSNQLKISTYGFSEKEVYHLVEMLNNMGTVVTGFDKHSYVKKGAGLRIRLSKYSNSHFLSLIEPFVMEVFSNSVGSSYRDILNCEDLSRKGYKSDEFDTLRNKLGKVAYIT